MSIGRDSNTRGRSNFNQAIRFSDPSLYLTFAISFIFILAFLTRNAAAMGVALISSAGMISIYISRFYMMPRSEMQATYTLIVGLTVIFPIALWREASALFHYSVVLLSVCSAFLVTRNPVNYEISSKYILILLQIVIFIYLSSSGLAGFPLERMIPNSSSNGITSYLIALQVNYCITHYVLYRKTVIITPLLTLLICIVGYGRSSILVALILISSNLVFRLNLKRLTSSIGFVAGALFLLTSIWSAYSETIALFIVSNTKFGGTFADAHRALMIREYISGMSLSEFLFGRSYFAMSISEVYNGNPHNSFIRGHHIFGIGYFILIFCYLFILFPRRGDAAVLLYSFIMLVLLFLRAATEPIIFPTMLDFFFFGMIYMIAQTNQTNADEGAHA